MQMSFMTSIFCSRVLKEVQTTVKEVQTTVKSSLSNLLG